MSFLVIFLGIIAVLFSVAFVTKRRFGILGLALIAGAYMSAFWVGDLTPIIAGVGIETVTPPLESVVSAGLIIVPAALLLLSGPTYPAGSRRLFGALLFAVLASTLLLEPLGSALIIDGLGKQVYAFLFDNRTTIVTICLVIALLDIVATKTPRIPSKH